MKRTYISPMAETIKLNLSYSVLDDGAGVGGGSLVGNGEDPKAQQSNPWSFDDVEEDEKQSNIWE